MVIAHGTRLYGNIRRCGRTSLATRFFHLSFMPLVPLATRLVIEREDGDAPRFLRASPSGRSILAAYLRTWGVLGAACVVFGAVGTFAEAIERGAWAELIAAPVVALAAVAAISAAFFSLGRLSEAEQRQQAVYARFVGVPIDPALLADRRGEVRRTVEAALHGRALALGLLGYRAERAAEIDWTGIALCEAVRDADFLEGALTLCRLEWAEAPRAGKADGRRRHQAIWQRLQALAPDRQLPPGAPPASSASGLSAA